MNLGYRTIVLSLLLLGSVGAGVMAEVSAAEPSKPATSVEPQKPTNTVEPQNTRPVAAPSLATTAMPSPVATVEPLPPTITPEPLKPATNGPLPDQFMLRMSGYFITSADILFRVDSKTLPIGAYVDFADTLGGQSTADAFRLDLRYRFDPQNAIEAAWYKTVMAGTKTLIDQDLQIGDQIFHIGTSVSSEISTEVYKLNYRYSVFHNDQAEISGVIGFHVMSLGIGLSSDNAGQSLREWVTAPLPIIGFYTSYHFTPEFMTYINYQMFFLNFENSFKGGLQDFLLGLEYRVIPNLAVGGALNSFRLGGKAENEKMVIALSDGYLGLMAYLSFYL